MRNFILIPLILFSISCNTTIGVSDAERRSLADSQKRLISQLDDIIAMKKNNEITIIERARIKEVATPTDQKLIKWENEVKANNSRPDLQKTVEANLDTIDDLLKEFKND